MSPASGGGASSLRAVNWSDARRKAWHAALMLASAYAATNTKYAWAVPVLTGMAGVSAPPSGASRAGAAGTVLAAAALGASVRIIA